MLQLALYYLHLIFSFTKLFSKELLRLFQFIIKSDKMNEIQKKWCEETLTKLMEKGMSKPFHTQLVDSGLKFVFPNPSAEIEQVANHNLLYVKSQLEKGRYKSVYEFGQAVNTIFSDGFANFKQNTLMYNVTLMLSEWFTKKISKYPRNEKEVWIEEMNKLKGKLDVLLEENPNEKADDQRQKNRNGRY